MRKVLDALGDGSDSEDDSDEDKMAGIVTTAKAVKTGVPTENTKLGKSKEKDGKRKRKSEAEDAMDVDEQPVTKKSKKSKEDKGEKTEEKKKEKRREREKGVDVFDEPVSISSQTRSFENLCNAPGRRKGEEIKR